MDNKRTILVVDDDVSILNLFQLSLKKYNFAVITGKNGKEAIELVKKRRPDLVLMDINMPEMDGLTACKHIKKNQNRFNFIPIILITGKGNINDKLRGLNSGADDYLTKPCEIKELIARVRSMLRIKQLTEQLQKTREELIEAKLVAAVAATAVTVNHEINTPLTRILVNTETICSLLPKSDMPKYKKFLDDISNAARQISSMTKKLAKLSKPNFVNYLQGTSMLSLDTDETDKKPKKK